MPDIQMPTLDDLTAAAGRDVDRICTRFEQAWQTGLTPLVEEFLIPADGDFGLVLLRELTALDVEYRRGRGGVPTLEDYITRWPPHAEAIRSFWDDIALAAPAEKSQTHTLDQRRGDETLPETPPVPQPEIPGFEIISEIGRGGMGVVYRARQPDLNRLVALKMIFVGPHSAADQLPRFRTEVEAAARLRHPGIVPIHAIGQHHEVLFIVLELVEGGTLAERMRANTCPVREAAQLLIDIADATHFAHEHGIIHRDLKPANVLLTESGRPQLTDFGLALIQDDNRDQSLSGIVVGTPSYMAPEQAAGRRSAIGRAADVYALGVILYEALIGHPPFRAATTHDTLTLVEHEEPVPPRRLQPNLPRDIETICLKCLRKEPARRYATAAEFADDLRRFLDGKPILARMVPAWERALKWTRRKPAVATLTAVIIVAITAGLGGWATFTQRLHTERNQSDAARKEALQRYRLARDSIDKLTELSEDPDLEREGMHPFRRRLLNQARDFYERFVQESGDDFELLFEKGLAFGRLGVITRQIGSFEEAVSHLEQGVGILDPLSREHPDDRALTRSLARNLTLLGNGYRSVDRYAESEQTHQRAIGMYERLLASRPGDESVRYDLANANFDMAWALSNARKNTESMAAYNQAIANLDSLTQARPTVTGYRAKLGQACYQLGLVLKQEGQTSRAEELLSKGLTLREQVAAGNPDDLTAQSNLALSLTELGRRHMLAGRFVEAEALLSRSLEIRERLVQQHPAVSRFQLFLVLSLRTLGRCWEQTERVAEAEELFRRTVSVSESIVVQNPTSLEYQRAWYSAVDSLCSRLESSSRIHEAVEVVQRAIEIEEPIVREHPTRTEFAVGLAKYYTRLAKLCETQNQLDEAAKWRERALETSKAVAERRRTNSTAKKVLAGLASETEN